MTQQCNFTPGQILSYLVDLEKHIKIESRIYIPSETEVGYVSDFLLQSECQRMLEFVGLGKMAADATFDSSIIDACGKTFVGSNDGCVHIKVSEKHRMQWKVCLATLAHEVCHHVIYFNGLNSTLLPDMVEVYTDLCSIYKGFGQLIIDEAEYLGKRNNGYLSPRTFMLTCQIVAVVCGSVPSSNTQLQGVDDMLDEAIALWESDRNETSLMYSMVKRFSAESAEAWRDIATIERLLERYKGDVKKNYEHIYKDFCVSTGIATGACKNRMAAFNSLYNHYAASGLNTESREALDLALYGLYTDRKNKREEFDLTGMDVVCPMCGKHHKHEAVNGSDVIKCRECGSIFAVDTTTWNPTLIQRRFIQRVEDNNRTYLNDLENRMRSRLQNEYNEMSDELKSKTRKELAEHSAIWQTNKKELESKELELMHREKMVASDEKAIVDGYVQSLPRVVRWIVRLFDRGTKPLYGVLTN